MASTSVVYDLIARDNASSKFDHLGNAIHGSSTKMAAFTGFLQGAGQSAFFALGRGIRNSAEALVGMVQNAVEDEAAQRKLAIALQNSVGATDAQIASVEKYISKVGVATGVTDDEMRPALQRLVESSGSVSEAQRQMSIALDVSAGTGKSLKTVTEALMKANNGTTASLSKLGLKTKDAEGNALTLNQALASMSETFGGQAAAKADTFGGKMDRLKLILDETKESIGAKLIPVITDLADWVLNTAVPAVNQFTHEWQKSVGTGGQVRDVLEKIRDVLGKVTKFLWDNKETVAALVAVYAGYKVAVVAANVVSAIQLTLLKAHTVGTIQNTVVTHAAAAASKAWAAAQWLLNLALDANPIGLVVIGVAALVGGFVLAYKKSETFRGVVNTLWSALKKFVGFTPLGVLIREFDGLKNAVGYVIDKVKDLISWLGKIHMPDIHLPGKPGWLPRTAPGGNSVGLDNPGAALIADIVKGIDTGKVKLQTALDKLKAFIEKHQAKLADLLGKKSAVVDALRGFASSIFSTDLSVEDGGEPAGIQRLLDFGRQQRANAEQLAANVKSLISKGLSKDLIQQLVDSGASGQAQINLLAAGTAQDIQLANEDARATAAALSEAGLAAGGALYDAAIKQEERDIRLAQGIKGALKELLDEQDKNTVVELHLDGHKILWSLKKIKRENGGHLGLGDRDPT